MPQPRRQRHQQTQAWSRPSPPSAAATGPDTGLGPLASGAAAGVIPLKPPPRRHRHCSTPVPEPASAPCPGTRTARMRLSQPETLKMKWEQTTPNLAPPIALHSISDNPQFLISHTHVHTHALVHAQAHTRSFHASTRQTLPLLWASANAVPFPETLMSPLPSPPTPLSVHLSGFTPQGLCWSPGRGPGVFP